MKQHKDIREILKRSGTAPTGICGFWRSAASFGCAFRRVCGVQISRGHLSRCGRFFGFLPLVMALAAVVVVWGAFVGIKIAIAHKNEEKINARDMVKNLIIGIIIIFVIAMGAPLLINGLSAWVG